MDSVQTSRRLLTPNQWMLLSVFLGILTGWSNLEILNSTSSVISTLVTSSLKLLSIPLIFVSIVATISGMRTLDEMKQLGTKVLKYTLITTLLAATLALVLFLIIHPVQHVLEMPPGFGSDSSSPTYLKALLDMYPNNVVKAFAENNVIGVLLLAVFLGFSILSIPAEHKQTLNTLFNGLFAALLTMTHYVILLLPIGIWAFVAIFVKEVFHGDTEILGNLLRYIITVFAATILQGVVVLPVMLKLKGISPLKTFKGMFSALSLAFFSKSSSASLPVTLKCAQDNLKISPRVANFSLPLCTTCNMNGCAAFILITVLFVSMSYGMTYSPLDLFAWILIATLAAIGNAGIPMGCYFLASAFLNGMNMPLEIMGFILPIYTLMDMVETSVNVWSDGCVTAIVDKEMLDSEAHLCAHEKCA
jgi:Na+/H+-dicarboxylate symporter